MKIQTLLMTLMIMVTCVPKISAMRILNTRPVVAKMALGMMARMPHKPVNASDNQEAGSENKKYSCADMFKAMRSNKKKIIAGLVVANDMYEYIFYRERFLKNLEKIKDICNFEQQLQRKLGNLIPCANKELLDVFEELKARMGIFENYKLYVSDKTDIDGEKIACHHQLSSRIIIFPNFFRQSRPEQIFTLCHELQHARQFEYIVAQSFRCNDEYYRDESEKEDEQDAEATAARMMTCTQCLMQCQKNAPMSEELQSLGYYIKPDFNKHIHEALKTYKPCKAHAQGRKSYDLRDYLPRAESK